MVPRATLESGAARGGVTGCTRVLTISLDSYHCTTNNRKKGRTNMSNLEEGNAHLTDLKSGPFSVLYRAVRDNTQVMVNMRNNHKLLGRVKAYDRHMNL